MAKVASVRFNVTAIISVRKRIVDSQSINQVWSRIYGETENVPQLSAKNSENVFVFHNELASKLN